MSAVSRLVRRGLANLVRLPLRLVPRAAVVRVLRGPLKGARWVPGAGLHSQWLGAFEVGKLQAFADEIRLGDVVFDVGAHVGLYTLLAARRTGPGGRVFSFEALPPNVAGLERHCRLNGADNVEVVHGAVSDRVGTVSFTAGSNTFVGHVADEGQYRVPAVRLDDFVLAQGHPPPRVLKMDIEGGEGAALLGARELLRRHRPVIFLATHGAAVHAECCALLRDLGYELRSVDGGDPDRSDEIVARAR
jgi:FkbM family methyltransferase